MTEPVAAHAFVNDMDQPLLSDEDRHHFVRVLRLKAGEVVSVSDGIGGLRRCLIGGKGELEPVGDTEREAAIEPALTVAFAAVKGDRPEWAVQKLTEAGVDRIVPLVTQRTVVRWSGDKAQRATERLRRVAREAAMQSRRTRLPEVGDVMSLAQALSAFGGSAALATVGGSPPSLSRPCVLVGPEGGWTPDERESAPATVGLGPHVLRTETAAVAAGVLLVGLRAGLVGELPGPGVYGARSDQRS